MDDEYIRKAIVIIIELMTNKKEEDKKEFVEILEALVETFN